MAAKTTLSAQEQYTRMTTAPVGPLILSLGIPGSMTHLITSIYNLADTFFVGQLGTSATAAVGVVFSISMVLNALGFWVGTGGSVLVSRQLGAQQQKEADTTFTTGFCLSFLFGALVCAVGLAGGEGLMRLLGATETLLPYAMDYSFWILLAAPFSASSLALGQCLRAEGKATESMIGQMTGGVLNMVLDPLFIFGLDRGIAGAALATAISQVVSWSIMFGYYLRGKTQVRFALRYMARTPAEYVTLFQMGFPSVCRHGCNMISNVVLNTVAGGWGDAAIAAMSVANRVLYLVNGVVLGLNQGAQPVMGYAHGMGSHRRVKESYWFVVRFTTFAICVMGVVGYLLAPGIIGIFRDDPEVIRIGTGALRWICLAMPFMNFMSCSSTLFQVTGNPLPSSVILVTRQLVFYVPALLLLPRVLGLLGLQMASTLADVLIVCVALPMVLWYFKKHP